ncbi:MAG: hypothetical protein EOM67_01870 [Spirochaetia bacterium]|nr:hypothetical protein [Spirochaetia bacterium]
MVRTRRVLAFSEKVLTYLMLFTLFFMTLFLMRLWWPVTATYDSLLGTIVVTLSLTTILYGIYIVGLIFLLLIKDHIFLVGIFIKNIIKICISLFCIYIVQLLITFSTSGIIITI